MQHRDSNHTSPEHGSAGFLLTTTCSAKKKRKNERKKERKKEREN
jgi:hypothetical protein